MLLGVNYGGGVARVGGIAGDDNIRRRIAAELAALRAELQVTRRDIFLFEALNLWIEGFSRGLRVHDINGVIARYQQEMIEMLSPLCVEHFGQGPPKIIRDIVEKMRDPRCSLYSEEFDREAIRILSAPQGDDEFKGFEPSDEEEEFSPEVLEELRRMQEENALLRGGMEDDVIQGALAMQREVRQGMERALRVLDEGENQWNRALAEGQEEQRRLRNDMEEGHLRDRRAERGIEERVEQFNQRVENLVREAVRLEDELNRNRRQMTQFEIENQQLQIDIAQVRASRERGKSQHWLTAVGSVVASIAASWALQTPVHITF